MGNLTDEESKLYNKILESDSVVLNRTLFGEYYRKEDIDELLKTYLSKIENNWDNSEYSIGYHRALLDIIEELFNKSVIL